MKRLTYLVVIIALIYSGYWAIGSFALQNTLQSQQSKLADEGWDIAYSDLSTRGFPSRFDTTVTGLAITTPDQSFRYAAPFVQSLALSYQPHRVIIAFAPTQNLTINDQQIPIVSDNMRASVNLKANTDLAVDTITAQADRIVIDDDVTLVDALAALRENISITNTYDTYITLSDIALPARIIGQMPATIANAQIDASITFDRPLDRHSMATFEMDPMQLRAVALKSLSISWGDFAITANGSFTVDALGIPDGAVTFTLRDWRGLLDVVQSAGLIPAQYQFFARSIGESLSQGQDTLRLPIKAENGTLSIGTFPIGAVPRLH